MKKLFLLTIILLIISTLSAQEKEDQSQEKLKRFYVSYSQGTHGTYGESDDYMINQMLTFGYKVCRNFRIDLGANYAYNLNNHYYSFTLLATPLSIDSYKIVSEASIGVGLHKSKADKKPEFIIPFKILAGYKVSDSFTFGMEVQTNLSVTKGWSYMKNNSVAITGLYVSIAF